MQKEVVIIIVPAVLEKEDFYKVLRKRNYEIAVLGEKYDGDKADYFIKADRYNIDQVVSELVKFNQEHKIAMIYSSSDFGIEIAAEASEILGLPYSSSYASVKRARNKYLTRQFLEDRGVPSPKFFLASSVQEIIDKSDILKFPIIVKPLNASGSCAVVQINCLDEVFEKTKDLIDNRRKMPFHDFMKETTEQYWIVEEYLDGIEVCVESYTYNKETEIVAIHDKYCNVCEPYFIEKTLITPSPRLSINQIKEIEEMTKKILSAIDYDYGISHVELKVTKEGPRLLEINARSGGGLIIESVLRSTGINMLEVLLDIRTGIKPEIKIDERKNVGFTMVVANEGRVVEINGFDDAKKIDGVDIAQPFIKVGDVVKARQAIYGGFILAKYKSMPEILKILDEADKKITIKVVSNDKEAI
ncbi:MAG: ATP-grasp domain-containing protein [Lachnospiraceae bacterium]|nr:ATP-grasp domain-containing protein [Lachnospiraceae bacterium]